MTNEAIAESRLDRHANIALYHQAGWMLIITILVVLKPNYYKEAVQVAALIAFLSSYFASRIYIQAGKKVEELKRFSYEEGQRRKREYMFRLRYNRKLWMKG